MMAGVHSCQYLHMAQNQLFLLSKIHQIGHAWVNQTGFLQTYSTWCFFTCFSHHAVPGQVHSISGFTLSSTSVELSWTPPLDPNGNITGYHIEYLPVTENGTHDNREVNITTPAVSYTVTGLEENTLYHFTVSTETSAGRGEGSTLSVRTSIARESL